jgi:glycosyltransferase involved in cell wall biosynthesis
VDVEHFHPRRRSQQWRQAVAGDGRGDGPIILYVGRIAKEKNLENLVDAARRIKGAHWIFVGEGPERSSLAEALRGVPHTFMGYLEGDDLAAAYASADLFIMPSTTEGCPNAVMEAFSSGLPVVGAQEFGTGDLINESGAGFTYPSSDLAEVYRQLQTILSDPTLAASYGAKARAFAESRSWDVMMAQLIKHYNKALDLNGLYFSKP